MDIVDFNFFVIRRSVINPSSDFSKPHDVFFGGCDFQRINANLSHLGAILGQ